MYEKELQYAKKAVIKAGEAILEIYKGDIKITTKKEEGFESLVTQADVKADTIIKKILKESFPEYDILSEESTITCNFSKPTWVIDPLDGTKEFIKKTNEFTVNIALVINAKPVLGVINVPGKQNIYHAVQNQGAFLNDQPIKTSTTDTLKKMKIAVSRSHITENEEKFIKDNAIQDVIRSGSSIKGCLVAQGKADIYYRFGNVHIWDICAMHAIINEAGGVLTSPQGNPVLYNDTKDTLIHGFIASNNTIHNSIISATQNE